jgi:predicted neutral ceramidase superfamily lipid hydrolase
MTNRTSLRVWFSLSLAVVAAATALTSWNLLRVLRGVQNAGSSGLLPVGRGIAEANQPLIAALYLGIACAVVTIIAYVRSSNNSPPAWLLLAVSAVAVVPLLIVWVAESLMLNALPSSRDGVVANVVLIQRLLLAALGAGVVLSLLLLLVPTVRVSSSAAPRRTAVAVCVVVTAFIIAVVALHLRNAWLNGLYAQL